MSLLLNVDFYTDFIRNKPVKFLDSKSPSNQEENQQNQLCPGNGSFHGVCSDMDEFSELLTRVPTKVLWDQLMTRPQQNQAWQLCNPGGSVVPARGASSDELRSLRPFMEQVIKEDHVKQWEEAAKQGKLRHMQ
jgi:hypothetical protein